MNAASRHEQVGFQWITIPDGVELSGNDLFDPIRMGEFYGLGFRSAIDGKLWSTEPPELRLRGRQEQVLPNVPSH
ncbi:MAG TPA: hypothetical protein VET87_21270 [Rubrivivax sp.]|nr:hypothetical protein [Rubrivivax sp.]